MTNHPVVSHPQWLEARQQLLRKEKEFTRTRDQLTQMRRELPWEKVAKSYQFDGPQGKVALADLFEDCSQLIVYHFMFGPDWPEGCKSCSLIADHYDPLVLHLKHRDVALVTVSRAPLATIEAFQRRMGWQFPWVSSLESDFNQDYHVSFTEEEMKSGEASYNYQQGAALPMEELPGISVFFKDQQGDIFHTYSTYARGLEDLLGIYSFLNIVPKGRDEADLPYGMAWVRHHDKYGDQSWVDPYVQLDFGQAAD